jgi:hypothetical protein
MGIVKLPRIYDYWSTNPIYHSYPIASRISRARFLEIKRYLHFVNTEELPNRGEEGYDRLGKIRPVVNVINEGMLRSYNPHRENAIDEAMIRFKGRSSLKQYVPKKPIRRGIKSWVRADSHNGYICQFEIYTGKDGNNVTRNLGESVVTKLTRELVGGNYHAYFDNYFTSVPLLKNLLDDSIYSCGTFRVDRKYLPSELKEIRTKVNTIFFNLRIS